MREPNTGNAMVDAMAGEFCGLRYGVDFADATEDQQFACIGVAYQLVEKSGWTKREALAAATRGTEAITFTQDDESITVSVGPITEDEAIWALLRNGWTKQSSLFGSFCSLVAPERRDGGAA